MKFKISIEDSDRGYVLTRKEEGTGIVDELQTAPYLMNLYRELQAMKLRIDRNMFKIVDEKEGSQYYTVYQTIVEV